MYYGEYHASFDTNWYVTMRIKDNMFDVASDDNDEGSQDAIITLFKRECMILHGKKPKEDFKWDDERFTIYRVGDAQPLSYRRERRKPKSK